MKTDYKRVYFINLEQESEHAVYACYNYSDDEPIGMVAWHNRWKRYSLFPDPHTSFSIDCMEDIIHFARQLK